MHCTLLYTIVEGGQRAPQRDITIVITRPSAAPGAPAGPFVALQSADWPPAAGLAFSFLVVLGTLMNNYPCLARYSCSPVAFSTLLNPHLPTLHPLHPTLLPPLPPLPRRSSPGTPLCARYTCPNPPPESPRSSWPSSRTRFTAIVPPCHFGLGPTADPHIISARYSLPPGTASHTTPLTWRSTRSILF